VEVNINDKNSNMKRNPRQKLAWENLRKVFNSAFQHTGKEKKNGVPRLCRKHLTVSNLYIKKRQGKPIFICS
jgi:hypothetical protein